MSMGKGVIEAYSKAFRDIMQDVIYKIPVWMVDVSVSPCIGAERRDYTT